MGYDHQKSPFGTRILLTCYFLFLLVSIIIYSNNNQKSDSQIPTIVLCLFTLFIFIISFYGLWFGKILILSFIGILFSILLIITFIAIILLITNLSTNKFLSIKTSPYLAHNHIWLMKGSTCVSSIIVLTFSLTLNVIILWGLCHLCSCIEHRSEASSYRKRISNPSQNMI